MATRVHDFEALRRRMEDGSLNLRGVAAALRQLEEQLEEQGEDIAAILRLLARDVDLEADAMGEAELAFGHEGKEGA